MAIWKRLMGIVTGAAYRSDGLQTGEPPYYEETGAANIHVDAAMQLTAVWACVKLLAETMGSLPLNIYEVDRATGAKTLAKSHNLQRMFAGKMNKWQTRQEFIESCVYQKALLGNAYSKIDRINGKVVSLLPFMSEQMEVTLNDNQSITYSYTDDKRVDYSADQVLHFKLFGNGVIGLSPLAYARNSLGVYQGAETATQKVYRNGGKPSGLLMSDKVLTDEQRAAIRGNFKDLTEGQNDRLFVLEAGFDYKPVSLSPQDIELLSARRFQIEDIARVFNVPSVLINDTQASTTWGQGIGELVQGFYKFGLRPYIKRMEAAMECALLDASERKKYKIEFDTSELLRPDQADRVKTYKEAIQGGIMMPNEARQLEGWGPEKGGDKLYLQQQMVPLGEPPPEPTPPPAPEPEEENNEDEQDPELR